MYQIKLYCYAWISKIGTCSRNEWIIGRIWSNYILHCISFSIFFYPQKNDSIAYWNSRLIFHVLLKHYLQFQISVLLSFISKKLIKLPRQLDNNWCLQADFVIFYYILRMLDWWCFKKVLFKIWWKTFLRGLQV